MYVPKNVIITKDAKSHPEAQKILGRIKGINPNVNVSYSKNELPKYSSKHTYEDRYHHMKDTVVIAYRKSPFSETFPSPGRIIEKPNTMIKSVFSCPLKCDFCYLQTTAIRHYRMKVYVNTNDLENEILNEMVFDPMVRSLLTVIYKISGTTFYKVPPKFNTVCDRVRKELNGKNRNKLTEDDVKNYLKTNLIFMLNDMGIKFERPKLKRVMKKLDLIYEENKKYKPAFVISEYTDLLAIDHIAEHFKLFMDLVQKNNDFRISFRTRAANVDRFTKYDGKDRVLAAIQLDPEHVIKNYQSGTSSLNDRIQAIDKIINASGFKLKVAIEPLLMYSGFEKDYVNLISQLAKKIDMTKVDNFDIGGLRASKNLQTCISKNYPATDVLNLTQQLVAPTGETKWRYPLSERVKIYKKLIEEIRKHTNSRITLGAENPEAWTKSGLAVPASTDYFYKLK